MVQNKKKLVQKDWFVIALIYLVAVVYRLLIVYVFSWNRGPHFENYAIAEYIVAGKGYWWNWGGTIPPQPTALLPPIYTYFLVFFMKLMDNPVRIIYIAQSFLNALGIIPSFYLGMFIGKKRTTGIVAAGLFAFFPEIAIEPSKLISEPLFIPCVVLVLYFYLLWKNQLEWQSNLFKFLGLGLILGIATLIKTTGSLIVLALFISLIFHKTHWKRYFKAAVFMCIGFFIAISPWLIRNYIVFDRPLMMASNFGYNLWRGNHPWGSGTEYLSDGKLSESELSPEYREYLEKNRPNNEAEMDRFYLREALKFIKQNPQRYIGLMLKRMFYFLTIDFTHPLTKNVFYIGGYIFVLFFGIWGGIILYRREDLDKIFWITPIIFFCFYTPVVYVPRFRLIYVLILLILSSVSISEIWLKKWGSKLSRPANL